MDVARTAAVVHVGREKAFEAVAALADHDLKDEDHPLFHIIINRQLKRILREEALQQGRRTVKT